ncbi:M28 family peptidase [Fluviicola taffensis]|uniref:Peptidase M28 n=1 Tax=Fluviicola taffensis (strain DSM 16823 / NCIMB 13979 / RW262) TaxID=755732 RepID=F2IF63_FLUTR|nr:M28 family peptidase [Fluviicola taffensis]AEA43537.1 peptidase M28 [Fluviicola taffensis DSM 16823]
MKGIISLLFSSALCVCFSQQVDLAKKYSATINEADLKKNLSVIASDDYLGRETGKQGQKMTADFLTAYFKRLGCSFAPGMTDFEQHFEVIESTPGGTLSLNGLSLNFKSDFIYYGCKSKTTLENIPVYAVEQLKEAEEKPCYVVHVMKSMEVRKEVSELKKQLPKHVKGIILVSDKYDTLYEYLEHYVTTKTMYLADEKKKAEFPILFLKQSALESLKKESNGLFIGKGKVLKFSKPIFTLNAQINTQQDKLKSSNVLAYIEGSDPILSKEVVIITAHYDHIGVDHGVVYNGADDDGTGTVALLELAEAFMEAKKNGEGPKRSILIMPVSGEEKGLLGSDYYSSHPIIPLENTVADLNIDMIGRNDIAHEKDTNYIYIIGSNMLSDDLHEINEAANKKYTDLKLDYKFNSLSDPNQFYYRSDHYNFAKHNIPVIFYFSGVHEDYHQPTDDVEKIIFSKVEKVARLVYFTAWELANAPKRITLNR